MRLLVLSDLHTEQCPFTWPGGIDFDVAVVAGDILSPGREAVDWLRSCAEGSGRPVVFVPGNREYYGTILEQEVRAMRARAQQGGVHLLDCDEVRFAGVRFLGCTLWTDFRLRIRSSDSDGLPDETVTDPARAMATAATQLNEYRHIRCEQRRADESTIKALQPADTCARHWRERRWLSSRLAAPFDGATVVVTHHAPHRGSLSAEFSADWTSAAFVSELPIQFFQSAALWIHGHTHKSFDYMVDRCRVISNPRGYRSSGGDAENAVFSERLVVPV